MIFFWGGGVLRHMRMAPIYVLCTCTAASVAMVIYAH